MEEKLIKKLMASIKCGVCGQQYEIDNIEILGHEENLWFLRVVCVACQTQYLAAAVIKDGKMPEIITDLTEAELDKFRKIEGLTADEVLDMHNFLKGFDGNFTRIFNQKQA
ncbi:MAG TPA: hypothetical protein G4N93_01010 [Dehalococcoidia bacterium]|nr:hypothetical protein [Dehalococcoidia bacterium]